MPSGRLLAHFGENVGVFFKYKIGDEWYNYDEMDEEMRVWCLMYADDMAVVANSQEELQCILDKVSAAFSKYDLNINVDKTEVMYQPGFGTLPHGEPAITVDGKALKTVSSFKYLGSVMQRDLGFSEDLNVRLAKCNATFDAMCQKLWKRNEISLKTKLRIYNAIIMSCLLYGAEMWDLNAKELQRVESFHAKCLRKILKVKYTEHRANHDIRAACNIPCALELIRRRRLNWLSSLASMRHDRYPKCLAWAAAEGKRNGRAYRNWQSRVLGDLQHVSQIEPSFFSLADWRVKARCRNDWKEHVKNATMHGTCFQTENEKRRKARHGQDGELFRCDICQVGFLTTGSGQLYI